MRYFVVLVPAAALALHFATAIPQARAQVAEFIVRANAVTEEQAARNVLTYQRELCMAEAAANDKGGQFWMGKLKVALEVYRATAGVPFIMPPCRALIATVDDIPRVR